MWQGLCSQKGRRVKSRKKSCKKSLVPKTEQSTRRADVITSESNFMLSSFFLAVCIRRGWVFLSIRASRDSHSTERRKTDCSIQSGNLSKLTIRSQRPGRQQAFRKAGFDPSGLHTRLCNSQVDFQPAYSCSVSAQARSQPCHPGAGS